MTRRHPLTETSLRRRDNALETIRRDARASDKGKQDDGDDTPDPDEKPLQRRNRERSKDSTVVTFSVPLEPGKDTVVEFPYPPSSDDFDFVISMLQTAKSRLIVREAYDHAGGTDVATASVVSKAAAAQVAASSSEEESSED